MSTTSYRSTEPLYLVIVRETNAQSMLQDWAKSSRSQVSIDGNRMKMFDNRSFSLFQLQWTHNWDNVTIWDCWAKRHINT